MKDWTLQTPAPPTTNEIFPFNFILPRTHMTRTHRHTQTDNGPTRQNQDMTSFKEREAT